MYEAPDKKYLVAPTKMAEWSHLLNSTVCYYAVSVLDSMGLFLGITTRKKVYRGVIILIFANYKKAY
jgi:hypothetical protein